MGAVCTSDGPKGMTDVSKDRKWTGWSGFPETFSSEHHQMINNAVAHEGFTKETITVECYTMKKLLAQNALNQVDLLTIAVEGHEFQVLRSIDFAAVNIDIIEVECPTNSPDQSGISMLLEQNGYAPGYRLWDNHRDLIFKKKA
ncbi:hypothetical protein CYMTET_24242 [Cymbomonas tetramitiformis]|uniref:Methyltransferase FkbM domain-containing protein n=1 Tax=Cymbomonas tetramitiformis TaxID=36881 RepID=A0AAE0FW90_9CHLO|nr:hypothetical protein CYMTET_24242 [Cymbomonas tetramitiformis]